MRPIDADATLETFQGLTELVIGEGAALAKALIFAGLQSRSVTPTISDWISVKERLPENNSHVVVYDEDSKMVWPSCYMAETFYEEDNSPYFAYHVNWWMPLPEPPKESEAE